MATTTPNFGWSVPTSSDLVKNGATAIETLGDSIDASMVDLKGGTTGQVLAKATNTDMDFTWTTPSAGSSGSSNVAGKNAVLNSNFSIWQRGTSIAASGGSGVYTADRWSCYNASYTVSQQVTNDTTNLPFITSCARVQRRLAETSTAGVNFVQPLESINSKPFIGKVATLSFYARAGANYSSASSGLLVFLLGGTGTDQNPNNTYTGQTSIISQTATLTTTWQRFSYTTGTIGTTVNELAVQLTSLGVGTALTNDYFEVTGVQLEIASAVSAYSPNAATQALELAACQRYLNQNTMESGHTGEVTIGQGSQSNTTNANICYAFPVQMRIEPTVTMTGLQMSDQAGFSVAATLSSTSGCVQSVLIRTTYAANGAQYRPIFLIFPNAFTTAFLRLDAEL